MSLSLAPSLALSLRITQQVCTGSENEMVVEGGEEEFVGKMVGESDRVRDRCMCVTHNLRSSEVKQS